MARYIARIRTPMAANDVFDYLADLRNFAEWDPGVIRSEQVVGDGIGPEAAYDVSVRNGGREMTLRYEVTGFDPPRRLEVVAKTKLFQSIDVIEVSVDDDEVFAVYDATLEMPFPLSIADPLLARTFNRIGDKAAAGLEKALGGQAVPPDLRPASSIASIVDKALEVPVVTSFTNIGYTVRDKIWHWTDLGTYDLSGRVVAITGPTSGLGLAAAGQLAELGARLVLIARNEAKAVAVRDDLIAASGNDAISIVVCDMGDLDDVRAAAAQIDADYDRLDVLIHNAGTLFNERRTTPGGMELTTAVQVVGPFLMTGLLLEKLAATPDSRVLTMSSGGMYTAGLTVDRLQMPADSYKGAEQYARAKRAQVTLNEMWAQRTANSAIRFHALHPGWADTPGVEESLPTFRKIVGPFLRSPAQGVDTLLWLAADDGPPLETNGAFWLDRRVRPIHKAGATRKADTPERRERLWEWTAGAAGWDLE